MQNCFGTSSDVGERKSAGSSERRSRKPLPSEDMIVCFDIGGVLVRICRTWEEGCRAAQVPVRPFAGDADHQERKRSLVAELHRGDIDDAAFHRELSKLFDHVWSVEEVARVDSAWLRGPYPGTVEVVAGLRRAGIATACLSNTSDGHWRRLLTYENVAGLGSRHASHLMGLAKPDPRIYAAFEAQMDLRPAEIVFFDDLQSNIDSAADRGWHAVRIDHEGDTAAQIRNALNDLDVL